MKKLLLAAALTAIAITGAAAAPDEGIRDFWPSTDFDKVLVPFGEIISGGVPRDAIPALTDPQMIPVEQTDVPGREPVMTVEIEGEAARAYPLRYLTWHEIVNDEVGGRPIAVTFCPLCNSGLVFDRRAAGQTLNFGVSGLLRHSDMIMFDRETESWWQQFTGTSIVGELAGTELDVIVSWMEPLAAFADRHPDGLVMAEPAAGRAYGRNPYVGYDSSARAFLYRGEDPPHGIEPLSRVVRVGDRAWPLERLQQGAISEAGVTIDWQAGMASALDQSEIASSRDIGFVRVQDAATGADILHEVIFAFVFHAFEPNGTWMLDTGATAAQ